VVGPEINDVPVGTALPLGIWVEVAGRKMQADFEPILERQIHHMINGAEGIWHMGQRDINWIRISQAAQARGFQIRHLGEIIHAKFLNDYPAIVDKVQVTIFTRRDEVEHRLVEARHTYRARNQRMESLTDESVDTFYSCLLCQSFAPNHVCVITPERLGLCGAYNWLDGKAAYEIDPTGPNQPLVKGECIDAVRGQWKNINDYVYANSKHTIESFNAYSLLDHPMTSCGCFEAIVALLPEANGVMIVNREYTGETPAGMKFSTLANMTGGGQQVPGFIGVGKSYVASRKFIAAEGGHRRIVWMPKELKETLSEELREIGDRLGIPDFIEQIADETVGTGVDQVRAHMERVGHPALSMPEITASSEHQSEPVPVPVPVPVAEKPEVGRTPRSAPDAPVRPPAERPATAPEADGIAAIITVLEQLRETPLTTAVTAGMSQQEQMAALQAGTAMHLLHAGTNMLLMYRGLLDHPPAQPEPAAPPQIAPLPPQPSPPEQPAMPERPIASAAIAIPVTFKLASDACNQPIRTVTLGGSGTRTSAVTIGGAEVLPFRHYQGNVGLRPVVAMEVFDQLPRNYPESLRTAFGDLLRDPAAMARHCVDKLGAEAISVRLLGTHPENGDSSPEAAAEVIAAVLKAVGVPLIVTGPNHFEKNNAVMKHIAAAFPGENLALNWVETDNYKTIAAAAMGYGHCVIAQTPIDVNMCKQLNILLTNLGVPPEKILVDPMTGALGYGLEYTYSVMERIRTSAFTGDPMLAMPMISMPGWEVARTKEARAPKRDFPLWGPESERGALLEIATAMSFLNSGADLLIMHHPLAARTVKRKIAEMMQATGN
jgi:CO dehydrogenase/CO-methylating acetyl-CoA synthase complex beta subunit/CO dehydrogenase/acetyl-CoA synthase delta subunit